MSDPKFTPGPWFWCKDGLWQRGDGKPYPKAACVLIPTYEYDSGPDAEISEADASLIEAAPLLYDALSKAAGYLLNAKIDIETGAKRATAIATIDGGLRIVREAMALARGEVSSTPPTSPLLGNERNLGGPPDPSPSPRMMDEGAP